MAPIAREKNNAESDAKLKEMILYISYRSQGDEFFGAVKLNKILFYADFIAYLTHGEAITGTEYFALDEGPAPKRLVPVREEMLAAGEVVIQSATLYGYQQCRTIAMRTPRLDLFSAAQIALVDSVIDRLKGKSGAEVSSESHKFIGWLNALPKETIPYSSALLDAPNLLGVEPLPLTPEQISYGKSLEEAARAALARYAA